jgi:acyl dehydratase
MLYFEDIQIDTVVWGPSFTVDRDELVAFAKRWDPNPFHVDDSTPGGVTAPGVFVLAIKQKLVHELPDVIAIIASLGYDEVRFHEPVRANDTLRLKYEWLTKRESASKPDRGVVQIRLTLVNQRDAPVMSHLDTILVRRRREGAPA